MSLTDARGSAARAAIAAACLDALPDATIGEMQLREDQRVVLARAQRAVSECGGCLIADEVGRGKTFVALALARQWSRPLIVVPAGLRAAWRTASHLTRVSCALESHESLSRGREPSLPFDAIIVDESHHFRTPSTRRYAVLVRLAARAPIVLLSATPLQNRARDLAAQLALFLGERAFALDTHALSRCVVRGDDAADAFMPTVAAPEWLNLDIDDRRVLDALVDLAAPARPLDGGDEGALRAIGLVRAWASSRAALKAALRSRRRVAAAIEQGVEAGRAPTRREIRAWHGAEDVVQLGFPLLLMNAAPSDKMLAALRAALDDDRRSMDRLSAILHDTPDPDSARIDAIRGLRMAHRDARIIAFSEYGSTILALFAAMRGDAGVGMLTAREARIASGRIARQELLARFAPVAQNASPHSAHEQVTLLFTTDLLAEGVNLQDASVVVHLDLPWNPARLAQRVGRVRRPGGAKTVRAYLLAPPASAAVLLNANTRLRRKLDAAESIVGTSIPVLPELSQDSVDTERRSDNFKSNATAQGVLMARLGRWHSEGAAPARAASRFVIAAAECETVAWLAALEDGRLICSLDGIVSETTPSVMRVVEFAEGPGRVVRAAETQSALRSLRVWLEAEQLATTCGLDVPEGPLRHLVFRWLSSLARSLPRHQRAVALPMIAWIRNRLRFPLPLGVELRLAEYAELPVTHGDELLDRLSVARTLLDDTRLCRQVTVPERESAHVVALILIGPSFR